MKRKIKRLLMWMLFLVTFDGEIAEEARKEGLLK